MGQDSTSNAPWILPLNARDVSIEMAGGKGANLARLLANGFPVPPGFVISTAAYRAFVAENGLADRCLSAARSVRADDLPALEAVSRTIRAAFGSGHLPPDLSNELLTAYAALGRPAVAVRSSATAEDLPESSFAGQQDTYLNVVADEDLLRAVVDCWSSLWTARAMGYRARRGIAQVDLALAVVVQDMVTAEVSGVLFTANPLTGKRTEMVIEATFGLGEAIVSGHVDPDRYVVAARTGQIESRALGTKSLAIQGQPGGGTIAVSAGEANRYALPEAVVGELADLGRDVDGFFGTPQDIEWAWAGGRLHLLQSRPITGLFPVPAGLDAEPVQVLLSFGAVQGILEPLTPLGQDAIQGVLAGAAGLFGYRLTAQTQRIASVAAERIFLNVTGLFRHQVGRRLLQFASSQIEPGAREALEGLLRDPRLAVTGGLSFGTLRRIVPFALPVAGRLILSLLRPDVERRRFQRQVEAMATSFEARIAHASTLDGRLGLTEEMLDQAFPFILPRFIPRFGASMAGLNLLRHLAESLPDTQHDALTLSRGLPHNVTTEMDLALWHTARHIKADPGAAAVFEELEPRALAARYLDGTLPPAAQGAVDGFLQRYGMRGPGEIDLGRPRWREEPTPVMQVLRSYLYIDDGDLAPDVVFARGAAAAEAGVDLLAREVRSRRSGWFKARLVHWAARRLRALAGLRELPKFYAIRMMGIVRSALLASGTDLVAKGRLNAPDDMFFLHLPELHALASGEPRDWPALVLSRREAHSREQQRQQIPRLLLSDGEAFYRGVASPSDAADVLVGSPVSPGIVEATVRVVVDPHTTTLSPGEILVCPGTDPGWTPLFLLAAGLVTEVGGLMTHGSVVAREYGIPAVVGVSQATTRLRTGQRVRLDGTKGRIVMLSSEGRKPQIE
jgi:phosphohistidine swiveling domain-containing protein